MTRKWTPLNFGKYKGHTLPKIAKGDMLWLLWAYNEEIFENEKDFKKEVLEFYKQEELFKFKMTVQEKIKGLWCYSIDLHPDMRKRADQQLQEAIELLSKDSKDELKKFKNTLSYYYLLTYAINHERPSLFLDIKGELFKWNDIVKVFGIPQKEVLLDDIKFPSERTLEKAYKEVNYDLNNYREFKIDISYFSNAKGIRILQKILSDKHRKGIKVEQRAFRSLKETLRKNGVPKWVIKRLKWENGKVKTSSLPEKITLFKKIS